MYIESNHPLIYSIWRDNYGYLHINGIAGKMRYLYYTVSEAKKKYLQELPAIASYHIISELGIFIKGIDNGYEDFVYYTIDNERKLRRGKVYHTSKGESYFNTSLGRMHLSNFIRHF